MADRETAAILLMVLAEAEAAAIVAQLAPGEIEQVGSAMYALGDVDTARVTTALDRFVLAARDRTTVSAEVGEHVSGVLTRALGGSRAPAMLERIVPETHSDPLPTLKWLSVDDLKSLAATEHPQLIAVLVAHMAPAMAAAVVASLPEADQADIVYRAATLGAIGAAALAEIDALLADTIGTAAQKGVASGGAPVIAAILNHVPKAIEQKVLKALAKRDKALAQQIEDDMVVFDDILALSDKELGAVCRAAEASDLALALKSVPEAARERIYATMSARAADMMRDAIAEQGPTKLADVQVAQRRIVALAKDLAESGTIQMGQGVNDYV